MGSGAALYAEPLLKERTKRFRSGVQKMSQYIGDICKG